MDKLTHKSLEALQEAQSIAARHGHPEVDLPHLAAALLRHRDGVVPRVLMRLGADPAELHSQLQTELEKSPRVSGGGSEPCLARGLSQALAAAETEAGRLKDEFVSVEHLALALIGDGAGSGTARALAAAGVTRDRFLQALAAVRGNQRVTSEDPEARYEALEKYGVDVVAEARAGKLDPVIGRDAEIRRVIRILSRKTKNNPVLIGEPGVGKTAIVEGLAQRIVRGDVPEWMKERTLFSLDMGALISGAK